MDCELGVEEVERFVQYQQLRMMQHGGDDAYLLLVSGGEVTYEFLCPMTSPFMKRSKGVMRPSLLFF